MDHNTNNNENDDTRISRKIKTVLFILFKLTCKKINTKAKTESLVNDQKYL